MDLLAATLEVPQPAAAPGAAAGLLTLLRDGTVQLAIGAGLLLLGLLIGRGSVRRPLPPMWHAKRWMTPLCAARWRARWHSAWRKTANASRWTPAWWRW